MCNVGAGVDQVTNRFGLKQVELPIQDCPASEFTRVGLTGSNSNCSSEYGGWSVQAAMRRNLEQVLAREGVRSTIERCNHFIEHRAVLRINYSCTGRLPTLERGRLE